MLSLTSSCCFVGGLVACKDKSDGEPTRVEQVDKVELLDSNITLKIGDVYKLKTSDGVEYYTFTSYDISLADSAEIIKEQETIKQLA